MVMCRVRDGEHLYKDDQCAQEWGATAVTNSSSNLKNRMLFKSVLAATALIGAAFAAPTEVKRQDKKLQWFGINESGAEFGEKNFTGVYGKEYTWYDLNTIDQFIDQGMNMFRLNFCKTPKPLKSLQASC
jgi:aryl-phospho-beta-D-glucosidase BglC (GH1 family)